ncbi:hypothetical protein [Pseudoclavibacter sp. 13-3]|uniref:hypothetical protein n=1 Tax=Pseudoclavibacter sp. 13-3 TaxID=2901228 RepID=UPI001E4B2F9B|nr:hypothetical protein [Pseudoclavibacter sp. 13-3]MCD7100953.1 hypothetical protein [Pseudoclavibacter sp. 13-3]
MTPSFQLEKMRHQTYGDSTELERLLSEFNTKLEAENIPPITKDELISSILLSRKQAWIPLVASLLGFAMLGFVMTQIPLNSHILYNGRGASNAHVNRYVMLIVPTGLFALGLAARRPKNGIGIPSKRRFETQVAWGVTLSFLAAQAVGMYAFLTASFS